MVKTILYSCVSFLAGIFLFSCAHGPPEREHDRGFDESTLTATGHAFMDAVRTLPDWESDWRQISKHGTPLPNESVLILGGRSHHFLLPVLNGRAITHLVLYEVVTHYDGDEAARVELQEPVILDKAALAESTIAWSVHNGELGARWRELGYEFSVAGRQPEPDVSAFATRSSGVGLYEVYFNTFVHLLGTWSDIELFLLQFPQRFGIVLSAIQSRYFSFGVILDCAPGLNDIMIFTVAGQIHAETAYRIFEEFLEMLEGMLMSSHVVTYVVSEVMYFFIVRGYYGDEPAGLGSPGGDDGGGNGQIAPKAKAIFRNSNMIDENWKLLERLLEEIMVDCLGGALYSELVKKLNGKTLFININPNTYNSGFGFTDGAGNATVNLGTKGGAESSALLHEMFHAFQAYHEPNIQSYIDNLMNIEMEAQIAQYMFVSRQHGFEPGSKWDEYYNGDDSMYSEIPDLVDRHLTPKGFLQPGISNGAFDTAFKKTAASIQGFDHPANNYAGYTYNTGRTGFISITTLHELTNDC